VAPGDRAFGAGAAKERSSGVGDDPAAGAILVAVDLPGRAPAEALARGAAALDGLARAVVDLGAARLRAGVDEGSSVGPEYVTMPRGVTSAAGEVAWLPARP
jgi:hypothetical protein